MKYVLITGCNGGIGKQLCKSFKNNGFFVIGVDICNNNDNNYTDKFILADISVENNIKNISSNLNQLDVLINNAAHQICKPLHLTSYDEFTRVYNVNVTAPFLLYKHTIHLLKKVKGSIINISSIHNTVTSNNIGVYASSKSALAGLTRSIAIEAGIYGVRCNTISPGAINTPMLAEGLNRCGQSIDDIANKHLTHIIGDPSDIAEMALFLADNDKSKFITGSNIYVDGGASIKLSTE